MVKLYKAANAIQLAEEKYAKLVQDSKLTEEQIEILFAVSSAQVRRFRLRDVDESFESFLHTVECAKIRDLRCNALKEILKIFNVKIHFDILEELMFYKFLIEVLKYNDYSDDICNVYYLTDAYFGETDIYDYAMTAERFIVIVVKDEIFDVGGISDDIAYFAYYELTEKEKKEFIEKYGKLITLIK